MRFADRFITAPLVALLVAIPARANAGGLPESTAAHRPGFSVESTLRYGRHPHADHDGQSKHDPRRWHPAPAPRWQVPRGLPPGPPNHRRPDWPGADAGAWHHGWDGHRYRAPTRYHYPHGYGRYHWRVWYTLPPAFLTPVWYVDHRVFRLAPPPRGCRWVRVDTDLLLVDLRSGRILEVLYDFFY